MCPEEKKLFVCVSESSSELRLHRTDGASSSPKVSFDWMDFFVNECRMSPQTFESVLQEEKRKKTGIWSKNTH